MSVFDTSAVLAILYGEEGRDQAKRHLRGGVISIVNVAEVIGDFMMSGRGGSAAAKSALDDLALTEVTPSSAEALRAAELKRVRGLSLGDRFCIALGEARGEPLVTGDQQWRKVPEIRCPLTMIR